MLIGASRGLGVVAYVCQVVQEVGKALESEMDNGGEGLSGLDPEVVIVVLYAVGSLRGGELMRVSDVLELRGCRVARAHLHRFAACMRHSGGRP